MAITLRSENLIVHKERSTYLIGYRELEPSSSTILYVWQAVGSIG